MNRGTVQVARRVEDQAAVGERPVSPVSEPVEHALRPCGVGMWRKLKNDTTTGATATCSTAAAGRAVEIALHVQGKMAERGDPSVTATREVMHHPVPRTSPGDRRDGQRNSYPHQGF